jgi:peptidoglycan/xylan/chitin deacetylase (PgdA/CDA1 family)
VAARGKGGVILLYHRVGIGFDPLHLNVSPSNFESHLEVIRSLGSPMALPRFVQGLQDQARGGSPPIALTFDDGYRDNLAIAAPLLERLGVPATVFVTTGPVDGPMEMWWDEVIRVTLPPSAVEADPGWSLEDPSDPTPAHSDLRRMLIFLRGLPAAERESRLAALRDPLSGGPNPDHSTMSAGDVAKIASSPAVDVGAHTVTHPVLAALDYPAQLGELQSSRERLGEIIGHPPACFAYPYGTPFDYDRRSVRAARECGFELACANVLSRAGRRSPSLELPRMVVRDWDASEFEQRLSALLVGRG